MKNIEKYQLKHKKEPQTHDKNIYRLNKGEDVKYKKGG